MMRSFRRVRSSKQVRGITRNVFRTKELKIANRRLMHTPWCMKKLGKSFYKRRFQPFLTENKQTNETPNPYMSQTKKWESERHRIFSLATMEQCFQHFEKRITKLEVHIQCSHILILCDGRMKVFGNVPKPEHFTPVIAVPWKEQEVAGQQNMVLDLERGSSRPPTRRQPQDDSCADLKSSGGTSPAQQRS